MLSVARRGCHIVRNRFSTPSCSKATDSVSWRPEDLQRRSTQNVVGKTPRRAVLYVPGNDERKISKLQNLKVDCAVLDCEDGVAMNRKKEARETIQKTLPDVLETARGEVCLRVNSASSGIMEEDIDVLLNGEVLPHAVMLPKVEKWQEVEHFFDVVNPILKQKWKQKMDLCMIIFIETALGLVNLREILESTLASSMSGSLRFEGVVFGSDDFCASIGVERTTESTELLYARQKIVAYAKAYDLQAIDLVHIDYKDTEGLRTQSLEGAKMGFTGKQVIHPGQVEIVQDCFTPSEEKIAWAEELISAFKQHQELGKGAFTFHGKMIDMPLLKQAQSIVSVPRTKR